jgi:protein-tyrosine-phosphatase
MQQSYKVRLPNEHRPMPPHPLDILVLCTGNSARSVLAEALFSAIDPKRFRGFSAGSHPKTAPHPFALAKLEALGLDTSAFRSKSWNEFASPGAPAMHIIVTVCDDAAGESCTHWPGHPIVAHWGIPDPASVTGTDAEKRAAFDLAFSRLDARVRAFAALPIEQLLADPTELKKHLAQIGTLEGATAIAKSGS